MNKGTIETLKKGEILLVSARKIKGTKVELEFAQVVETESARPQSIIGLLNRSDDRFNQVRPIHAWISAEPKDATEMLGIDFSSLTEEGQSMELNVLNPTIAGQTLNLQITETTKGSEYDVANMETTAKRAGKDGDYILTTNGEFIYRKVTVVTGQPKHFVFGETQRYTPTLDQTVADALKA